MISVCAVTKDIQLLVQHIIMNNRSIQVKRQTQKLFYITKNTLFIKKWRKEAKNSRQRFNILKEWEETQKSYIQDLKIIEKSIQIPLLENKLISKDEERILFPNIKGMIDLSENLCRCISQAITSWSPNLTVIGEDLILLHKFFMIYREYCNNFMKGQEIIKKVKLNPLAIEIESKLKLDFGSYIIKPVQRPPKYQLLLRQYSKAIFKSHIDYAKIQLAIAKYHEVNDLNNQSMDRQIRAQKMIKLDRKYGDIISSRFGRQFQKEFSGFYLNSKCQIHAFNDMILIIKANCIEPVKRLYLDCSSFTKIKGHLKFYKNFIFLCGIDESIHLQFENSADVEHFSSEINIVIKNLARRQDQKRARREQNETKRKNLAKFKVLAWQEQLMYKIVYKNRMEVNIIGIVKEKDEYFYNVEFKLLQPSSFSQRILLNFKKVVEIQQIIINLYKELYLIRIDDKSDRIGIIQATTNKLKVIENRSFVIESYLNFILRCQLFYKSWKDISMFLGLHPSFVKLFTSENYECLCNLCVEMKQHQSLEYYQGLLNGSKKGNKNSIFYSSVRKSNNNSQERQEFFTKSVKISKKVKQNCEFYVFNAIQNIKKSDKRQFDNFNQRMLALQAQMGQINYSYFKAESAFLAETFSLKIYLLSVSDQYIQIQIDHDKYIRQILQEIAQKNTLSSIFDWAIYLQFQNKSFRIGNDEKIVQFVKKWGVELQKNQDKIQEPSFLQKKLSSFKKWGEQMLGTKKGRLFLKKYVYFEPQIQLKACKQNKERYHFLINQIFGRIRFENMALNMSEIIEISAFFLLKNQFESIKYFLINMDTGPFKKLLPEAYFQKLNTQSCKKELCSTIKKHYEDLLTFKNQRNAIQLIFIKIFHLLKTNTEWLTKYFQMFSYKETIENIVIIGINHKMISVKDVITKMILFEVSLSQFKYQMTSFEMTTTYDDKEYIFVGSNAWNIHNLITLYETYNRLYPYEP